MLSEVSVRGLQPELPFMHLPSSNTEATGDLIHRSSVLLISTLPNEKGGVIQEIRIMCVNPRLVSWLEDWWGCLLITLNFTGLRCLRSLTEFFSPLVSLHSFHLRNSKSNTSRYTQSILTQSCQLPFSLKPLLSLRLQDHAKISSNISSNHLYHPTLILPQPDAPT